MSDSCLQIPIGQRGICTFRGSVHTLKQASAQILLAKIMNSKMLYSTVWKNNPTDYHSNQNTTSMSLTHFSLVEGTQGKITLLTISVILNTDLDTTYLLVTLKWFLN